MTRAKLPGRREAETVEFTYRPPRGSPNAMVATIGRDPETGKIAEVFVNIDLKTANDLALLARDTALVISIALQHGTPIEELSASVGREDDGTPQTVAGSILDMLATEAAAA